MGRQLVYVLLTLVGCGAFFMLHSYHPAQKVVKQLDLHWLYKLRHMTGFTPTMDERLKVYVLDDLTVSSLKTENLSISRWYEIFEAIDHAKPSAIITPHQFSVPKNLHNPIDFSDQMDTLTTKIATGVWLTKSEIPGLLSLEPKDYPNLSLRLRFGIKNPASIKWNQNLGDEEKLLFGPHPGVMNAFRNIGVDWTYSSEVPFVSVIAEEHLLPHLAIYAADTATIEDEKLYLNEVNVPLTKRGNVYVNYVHPNHYLESIHPLITPIRRVMKSKPFDENLTENDTVLILPKFYTGNIDPVDTPFGTMPSGYVTSSIISSVLSGKWLKDHPAGYASFIGAAFFSLLVGCFLNLKFAVLATTFLVLSYIGVCSMLFSTKGLILPVSAPAAAFMLSTFTNFSLKSSRQKRRYTDSLRSGRYLYGRRNVSHLEKRLRLFPEKPRKQVVSLITIKLSGTPSLVNAGDGAELFDVFKRVELSCLKEIYECGGIEVRSNQGLKLGMFTNFTAQDLSTPDSHADRALTCAVNVLEKLSDAIDEEAQWEESQFEEDSGHDDFDEPKTKAKKRRSKKLDYPSITVKMAVTSGTVHLGNFGSPDHLIPTVIGPPVSHLQALIGRTKDGKISVTKSTLTLLDTYSATALEEPKTREFTHETSGEKIQYASLDTSQIIS